MDVPGLVVRRRRIAITAALLMSVAASALVAPEAAAGPWQEDPSSGSGEEAAAERGLVDIDVDVANDDASSVAEAATDINRNVAQQLEQLRAAEGAVNDALARLAAADGAVLDTELRIEELVRQSDRAVVNAFTSPPADAQLDALLTRDGTEATLKQTYVDMQADSDADVLADLDRARNDLEEVRGVQRRTAAEAERAVADADAALSVLEGAFDQQTQFLVAVQDRIRAGLPNAATDPALLDDINTLTGALQSIEFERQMQELAAAMDRARRNAAANGELAFCPVNGGGLNFTDTWGAARSGGRSHKGTDMMASTGTPTPAPVDGRVEYHNSGLGGLAWYLYGDNGHRYYGAHLSDTAGVSGWVQAGTVIGYVGHSGNADASAPHLHFEFHPNNGSAINPYPILHRACPGH